MSENTDQKNSEYKHFSRSINHDCELTAEIWLEWEKIYSVMKSTKSTYSAKSEHEDNSGKIKNVKSMQRNQSNI